MAYGRTRRRIKRFFKSINFLKITIRAFIIFLFACLSFIASSNVDINETNAGLIDRILSEVYFVFAFPFIFLFYRTGYYNWPTYYIGLFIDAYFYSMVISIILFFVRKVRPPKEKKEETIGR